MFKLLAISSVINMIVGIFTNLKSIVGIAIIGTLAFFGYLMYHNGMNVGMALGEVEAFWLSAWEWAKRGWAWGVSVMPF